MLPAGDTAKAVFKFVEAAEHLMALRRDETEATKKALAAQILQYVERAERLKASKAATVDFPQAPSTVPNGAALKKKAAVGAGGVDLAALGVAMASQELINNTSAADRSTGALQAATTLLLQAATNARPAEEVAAARAALLAAAARAGLTAELTALQIQDGHNASSRRSKLAVMHRVVPRLWVGQFEALRDDCRLLREHGVTHVVSVMSGAKEALPADLIRGHLHVRVDDTEEEAGSLAASFPSIADFIDGALSSGGVVFVHCGAGISRSVTATCAYLVRKYSLSAADAIGLVRRARPCASPNEGFVAALERWAAAAWH